MKNIRKIKTYFPICYDNYKLDILSSEDLNWYVNNCRKKYYEEYLDFKFSTDISKRQLTEVIHNMILSYKLNIDTSCELRVLLKNITTGEICGGCTIFEKSEGRQVELAYFIVPKYQGKNLCVDMIKHTIDMIKSYNDKCEEIVLTIRYDNQASINIANRLGFYEKTRDKGRFKENIIFAYKMF